jgi:tRNA pseudouridine55 synthase
MSDAPVTPPNATPLPTPRGLLIIDKQPKFTSMDVCAILRTRLRRGGAPKRIKVGHAGTLDPLATGVLVVLIGKATTLVPRYMAAEKEYETTVDLSRLSTTDDLGGVLTEAAVSRIPTRADVDAALARFTGTIEQTPPQYSAMRVGGRRAYEMAREGEIAPLQPRPVTIHAIEVLGYTWPLLSLRIRCGKGVYIRSLGRDLGAAMGVGGMLTALRRTRVGACDIQHAARLDQLPEVLLQEHLLPAREQAG